MMASELVKAIQKHVANYGDMNVVFHDKGFGSNYSNCFVDVDKPTEIHKIGTLRIDVWC